jgi:hypothetical protein
MRAGAVIRREIFNGTMKQAHKTQKLLKPCGLVQYKKGCNIKSPAM